MIINNVKPLRRSVKLSDKNKGAQRDQTSEHFSEFSLERRFTRQPSVLFFICGRQLFIFEKKKEKKKKEEEAERATRARLLLPPPPLYPHLNYGGVTYCTGRQIKQSGEGAASRGDMWVSVESQAG